MLTLPKEWIRLHPARRQLLWELCQQKDAYCVVLRSANMRRRSMIGALSASGLASFELVTPAAPARPILHYAMRATPEGRALVAHVEAEVERVLCNALWAWIQCGPGLNTRKDF